MHDLLDNNHEYYKELVEGGRPPAEPHVLSLPKGAKSLKGELASWLNALAGTFIPESLTLFYETTEWFTLQPSHPMKLTGR